MKKTQLLLVTSTFFLTKTTALPTPEATKAVGGFFLTFGRYPKSTGCLGRSGMGMGTGGIIIGIAGITYSHMQRGYNVDTYIYIELYSYYIYMYWFI